VSHTYDFEYKYDVEEIIFAVIANKQTMLSLQSSIDKKTWQTLKEYDLKANKLQHFEWKSKAISLRYLRLHAKNAKLLYSSVDIVVKPEIHDLVKNVKVKLKKDELNFLKIKIPDFDLTLGEFCDKVQNCISVGVCRHPLEHQKSCPEERTDDWSWIRYFPETGTNYDFALQTNDLIEVRVSAKTEIIFS
jgi:hypothetical protein